MNQFEARSPDGTPLAVSVDGHGPPIARTGGPVAYFGHSYGANCAMDRAALTRSVVRLVLYDPSLGSSYPPGALDANRGVDRRRRAGRRSRGSALVNRDIRRRDREPRTNEDSEPTRIACDWIPPRDVRVEEGWTYRPGQFDMIEESPWSWPAPTGGAAGIIPGGRLRVLDDHGHMAHKAGPILVADLIRTFVSTGVLA